MAAGQGDEHRTALDRAEEKLRRQLEKPLGRSSAPQGLRTGPRVTLRLRDLLERRGDPLQLECLTGDVGLDRLLPDAEVASPGLVLAGYTARFLPNRMHVLGETEITYLNSLDAAGRPAALAGLLRLRPAGGLRHQGAEVPPEMLELAARPRSRRCSTRAQDGGVLSPASSRWSRRPSAPRTTLHGSLADVYGVGLLFIGRSGIGKSECVLDLVERGHRLVADDVVQVTRRGNAC